MKKNKIIEFLTVTLFMGILLTFTIYIGLSTLYATNSEEEENKRTFNDFFYTDGLINDVMNFIDYRLFGRVGDGEVILGKDQWLFEAIDSDNGYERLLDYIGGCPFSEEELSHIANALDERQSSYEEQGMKYMLVVIPDSMTVGEEYVPWYLGKRSENTRFSQLTAYLDDRGSDVLIDTTIAMLGDENTPKGVNNTENSINAYGAFCIYNGITSKILANTGMEISRIHEDDIAFYTRITDGKEISRKAGLEESVKNKTVSLSDELEDSYRTVLNEKGYVMTQLTDVPKEDGGCVVIECTHDWDRIQLTPFFSNTFNKVYYKDRLMSTPDTSKQYGADYVIQIIHESELSQLLTW